ncbi:hypothetical protein PsYK624_138510 [Phanerochaete sordida]|uniref:F-box domain-containing protein n=1 Tax=Phanerochaete sordida TaxID=48140 RepID=A0A9P3LJR3_9APHY|nr:hypothetical protein PsYK624_138510 [Phanerochaete sordida]
MSQGILPFFIRSCPRLEVVILNDSPGREAVDMLWSLNALERVECTLHGMETSEFWDANCDLINLARAPALSYLSVSAPWDYGEAAWYQSDYEPMPFASLKTLKLFHFPYEDTLVALLEKLDAPLLQTLEIGALHELERYDEDHFASLLGLLEKFPQLRALNISGLGIDEPLTLQPSLKLWGLEELEIDILDAVDESFVSQLARACPQLRRFVGYTGPHEYASPWDLNVLEECAASMPRLEYLHTEFYTEYMDELKEPTARSLVPITIMVGNSRLAEEDWGQVAAYIAKIYPNAICRQWPSLEWDDMADDELVSNTRRWRWVSRAVAEVGSRLNLIHDEDT